MSATDELRRMLDERGVEYVGTPPAFTAWWGDHDLYWSAMEVYDGELDLGTNMSNASPEQAIAATLGRGECHNVYDGAFDGRFVCSECNAFVRSQSPVEGSYVDEDGKRHYCCGGSWNRYGLHFCPNCGRRVVE